MFALQGSCLKKSLYAVFLGGIYLPRELPWIIRVLVDEIYPTLMNTYVEMLSNFKNLCRWLFQHDVVILSNVPPGGCTSRTWYLKVCAKHLFASNTSSDLASSMLMSKVRVLTKQALGESIMLLALQLLKHSSSYFK